MTVTLLVSRTARLAGALVVALALGTAVLAPVFPVWLAILAATVLGLSLWRPDIGVLLMLALAPWGARFAGVPVRASEALCAAFLLGWLVRLDRTLVPDWRAARAVVWPALLYALVALVSRARVGVAALAGAPAPLATAREALRAVPADYLVTAGRDPHTAAAVQIVIGVVLFVAVLGLCLRDRRFVWRVGLVVGVVGVAAALATVVAVPIRYWQTGDTNELIRYFVVTRSRYAFHLADVNAAGSHFILGALLVLGLAGERRQRAWAWGSVVVTAMALWICGSRAAIAAGVGLSIVGLAGARVVGAGLRWPQVSSRVLGTAGVLLLVGLSLSPTVIGSANATTGSASRSLSVREEFLVTSLRMIGTAPVFGVGVGTYLQRSNAFMPPGIRTLYGRENAHNYFMQTVAELGVVGIAAFLWWLGAVLGRMWRQIAPDGGLTLALGLFLGVLAFLLTCVTGHPFLVVEASIPFWAALGAGASETAKVY